jgi:exonuclease SbcC
VRIKEFSIRRYGPLSDIGRISLGSFSVFYGRNERGKTLTIDSLVKLLFKRDTSVFEDIDRVDEDPDGYLIIEDRRGKEIKLPEKGDLTKVADITPWEFRNTFVIRSSDLLIKEENKFYEEMTDRLAGLKTGTIRSIKEQLKELGKLTRADSDAALRDIKNENLKARWKKAPDLVERIDKLIQEVEKEGFDEHEQQLLKIEDEIEKIGQKQVDFEDAHKRERYEAGSQALQTIASALEGLRKLEVYNEDDERAWVQYEERIKTRQETENKLDKEFQEVQGKHEVQKQDFGDKERKFQILKVTKREVDKVIRTDIELYKRKSGELATKETKNRFFTIAAVVSAALLLASLFVFGAILRQTLPLYIASSIFFVILLVSSIFVLLYLNGKAGLAKDFEKIRLNTSKFKLDGATIGEILSKIQQFDDEYSLKEGELQRVEQSAKSLEDRAKDLRERLIPDVRQEIAEAGAKIDGMREKAGVQTLEDYQRKLKSKRGHEGSRNTQEAILKGIFGSKARTLEENLAYWEAEVDELREFEGKAKGVKYNDKVVEQLDKRLEEVRLQKQDYEHKMTDFSKQLNPIEIDANDILRPEGDHFLCATSLDMKAIREKLQDFIREVEENMNDTIEVMKIFEELQSVEEEKVSDLFGEDSPISNYFNKITDSLYDQVEFVPEEGKLKVRRTDGEPLDANKLSSAAYDQLYLSIRLALGEKLLKGDKGFFIMDDPFIRADTERLQKQLDILKSISESGWQIIYFTAKDEVRQALRTEIESGKISCTEIESTADQTKVPTVLNSSSKPGQGKSENGQTKLFPDH